MEKCWFVLPQTHYPPPDEDGDSGSQTGPLCLGHFVEGLRHVDQVINNSAPVPFPLDMPIYRTPPVEMSWETTTERGFEVSPHAQIPVATTGVTAKANLSFALKKTVQEHWQIQKLETMIIQPSRAYISRCLASEPLVEFLKQKRGPTWSVYMITGLKIARGDSSKRTVNGREKGVGGGLGAGAAGLADASLESNSTRTKSVSVETHHSNDFIWAVRLAKITKGLFDKTWRQRTYSRGATFDMSQDQDIYGILEDEGFQRPDVLEVGDDTIVVS